MKNWLVLALGLVLGANIFGQNIPPASQNSGSSVAPDAGISFNLPAGSWQPISESNSLVPFMEHKISEQIETQHKVTVIFQSTGPYEDVLSLFDQAVSVFGLHWGGLSTVQPVQLVSPVSAVGGPRKFTAVYRIVDKLTSTPFRLEVVVVSPYDMRGNKGILFIICPEYNYYDSRFLIASVRNALVLDVNAATAKQSTPDTTATGASTPQPAAVTQQ